MSEEKQVPVIGYGTAFNTSFMGYLEANIRVVSPVDCASPKVDVTLTSNNKEQMKTVEVEGEFFESLLSLLNSIKEHTSLLSGSESSFFKDASAVLFSDIPPARVIVSRAKKMLGGVKDEVFININGLSLKKDLDESFFQQISELQKTIQKAKEIVSSRIESYLKNKK